jgi:hypothetical protein
MAGICVLVGHLTLGTWLVPVYDLGPELTGHGEVWQLATSRYRNARLYRRFCSCGQPLQL